MREKMSKNDKHHSTLDFASALQKLTEIKQQHILKYWEHLSENQKNQLLAQIEELDSTIFKQQQKQLQSSRQEQFQNLKPFTDFSLSGADSDFKHGKELISQGLLGCLIVAGGQGTRLRFDGPKGIFPVSPVRQKSLFQLFAEKVVAASRQAKKLLPLAIMTSPLNHAETVAFFEKHNLFGLEKQQLYFFSQGTLPLLDEDGNLFLEDVDSIARGPDGNGSALQHFYQSGIWSEWHRLGINYLNFCVIDNPLADPFDAELLGFHYRLHSEITVKGTMKRSADEKVGTLAKQDNKTIVVEYTELPEPLRSATLPNGTMQFGCANLSLFCFNMNFIKMTAGVSTPFHLAFKAVNYLNAEGISCQAEKPMAWKFEKFIFDVLPIASKVSALLYPREACFAPLKNYDGPDSIDSVRKALQNNDRSLFAKITGSPCTNEPFEISQEFYYPTPELIAKWRGKTPPASDYIEA